MHISSYRCCSKRSFRLSYCTKTLSLLSNTLFLSNTVCNFYSLYFFPYPEQDCLSFPLVILSLRLIFFTLIANFSVKKLICFYGLFSVLLSNRPYDTVLLIIRNCIKRIYCFPEVIQFFFRGPFTGLVMMFLLEVRKKKIFINFILRKMH